MKKVPHWIKKVVAFTQLFPDAEIRNHLLDELITGQFDYEKFDALCREYHIAYSQPDKLHANQTACSNQWEAVEVAGQSGVIESMQGVLHRYFYGGQNER